MAAQGNCKFKPAYQVIVSGKIAQDLQHLKQLAITLGKGKEFLQAWESAMRRLETDPLNYGEMFKHLKQTLSHRAFVAVDSFSRSCSGVNLSTSHQRRPSGQGTPRRWYGVVPRRRPVRN